MSQKSLLNWLSETDASWRWQTVLDTLALGEGIPLRLIDLRCLQDFHGCLHEICRDSAVQEIIKAESFEKIINAESPGGDLLCKAFEKYFGSEQNFEKKIRTWVRHAGLLREAIKAGTLPDTVRGRPVFPKEALHLFDEAFPFFSKKVFKTLTANAIPLDFLSKLVMSYWRWYKLLWLYHEFMMKGVLEQDKRDGLWRVCDPAFEVPGLYFIWRRLETNPDLLLLVGPVFGSSTEFGGNWRREMEQAATFFQEFQRRIEGRDGISIQKERFLRAAHAEAIISPPNLKRSADQIVGALASFSASWLPKESAKPRGRELRLMALLSLFLQQNKKYLFFTCQRYMNETDQITIALRRGAGSSEEMPETTLFARITANTVELGIDEGNNTPINDSGSDFRLFLLNSSLKEAASQELLEELDPRFSRLLTDFHRHATLFNSERVSILDDRLQNHWGRLVSDDPNAFYSHTSLAHRICARIAELARADIATLYEYDTLQKQHGSLNAIGMYFSNPFHLGYAENLKSEMQAVSDIPERRDSVCYRTIDKSVQKIIFDYDEETGRSEPPDEPIYVPQGQNMPVFRGTIATPITFNGRIIALLEVNAREPWTFHQNQLFSLQQIASALSPFLYHHRYVRTLQGIQEAILDFHAKKAQQDELYNGICKLLTGLFVCHGAAMWVRDTEDTNRFIRKGFHNVEREYDNFDLTKNKTFVGRCIEQFSGGGNTQHFNTDCEDTSTPVLNREELLKAGIKTMTVVLIPDTRKDVTAAITLYGEGDYEPYDAAWDGIMHFISSYISLVVEAVNAFVSAQRRYEASHVHELYHDAALISDKGKKLAYGMRGLRHDVKTFWDVLDNPWFKEELRSPLLGMIRKADLNALKDLPRQFDSRLFRVDKDLEYYSRTLLTRIEILFGKEPRNLPQKAKDFLQSTGDEELLDLAGWIDWEEEEEWVPLWGLYLGIRGGNSRFNQKGLYFDDRDFHGLELYSRKTTITTVLRNLLTNAIKYSLKHKAIAISQRPVGGNQVSLSIQNEGRSFDRLGEASWVLGPNRRGSNANKTDREDEGGLGMGLYMVKQLCRHLLDADFLFQEEPKGGGVSIFRAELFFPGDKVRQQHDYGHSG